MTWALHQVKLAQIRQTLDMGQTDVGDPLVQMQPFEAVEARDVRQSLIIELPFNEHVFRDEIVESDGAQDGADLFEIGQIFIRGTWHHAVGLS